MKKFLIITLFFFYNLNLLIFNFANASKLDEYEIKTSIHVLKVNKTNFSFLNKGWDEKLKDTNFLLQVTTDNLTYEEFRYRSFFEFLDDKGDHIITINPHGHLFLYDIRTQKSHYIESNLYELLNRNRLSEKTPFIMAEKKVDQMFWLSGLGARDMEIAYINNQKYLLVLASFQVNKYCMKDVILKSKVDNELKKLNFSVLFKEDDCSFRGPNQASSRIEKYDRNSVIITQGLGQIRDNSDKSSIFSSIPVNEWPSGKLLKVNINDGKHKIFSIGHRNPQGLTVLKNKTILSTEHGPRGEMK